MSNIAGSCGTGPSIGVSTPPFSVVINVPCLGFSISLPSFSFSFALPSFSLAFFISLFLNLEICDLSLAFNINAGVAVAAFGGCIQNCVPDPSLAEQTYAVAA
jgi:hypothetical protein